jgi:hypothetical protein
LNERVYNREEWKEPLRMARNCYILHMPMEWMNEWMNERMCVYVCVRVCVCVCVYIYIHTHTHTQYLLQILYQCPTDNWHVARIKYTMYTVSLTVIWLHLGGSSRSGR